MNETATKLIQKVTYVNRYVRHRFYIVRQINTSTVSSLVMPSTGCAVVNNQTSIVLTSGEASSKITAPRVSTWITLAVGSGEDMLEGRWDMGRLGGVGGIKRRPFGCCGVRDF
jgi:hypothetical protein